MVSRVHRTRYQHILLLLLILWPVACTRLKDNEQFTRSESPTETSDGLQPTPEQHASQQTKPEPLQTDPLVADPLVADPLAEPSLEFRPVALQADETTSSLPGAGVAATYPTGSRAALEAPPIETDGQTIRWEGWTFNWQYRNIEGLVLTNVHFHGRKVLKYIGLAEIYVPYATGTPRPVDFALGGFQANPLPIDLARDCYATEQCQALNRDGKPAAGGQADLMIHSENTGFAYAGATGRAPGKMLVLWSMCHFPGPTEGVSNDGYTYVIRWKLSNDGQLRAEVGATGGLQHLNIGDDPSRGTIVGQDESGADVFAPSHVHNFYFRVDLDIDGPEHNIAQELNYLNDETDPLMSRAVWQAVPQERGRVSNEQTFRSWRVINPKSLNAQGHPRSYHLIPSAYGAWRDGSNVRDYWVLQPDILFTKFHENEFPYTSTNPTRTLNAIQDEYMNQESLLGEDIVIWYRICFLHHPRSEDWPAQPIVWRGFDLMPRDFLDHSPLAAEK